MKINTTYYFEFPTINLVELSLANKLSSIANTWAYKTGLSYPALGCPNAYGTVGMPTLNVITGIDIPVLIKGAVISASRKEVDSNKGTIVILAQDPLRKASDYPDFSNWSNQAVVSLPFGVHVNNVVPVVNRICNYILGKGYDVYITDCEKVYPKGIIQYNAEQLLIDELSSLNNVTHCIALGSKAQKVFSKISPRLPHINAIPMIHPSGTANSAWSKVISPCTANNKVKEMVRILGQHGI